jgi:hypothetical protein
MCLQPASANTLCSLRTGCKVQVRIGTNQIKRALKQGYTSLEICQNHLHLCSKDQIDDDYEELLIDMESMPRPTADPDSIPEHEGEGSRSNTPEPPHPAAAL